MRKHLLLAMLIGLVALHPAIAAPKSKASRETAKERLVLMPLRLAEEDNNLQGAMETALVEGLETKYEVFAGERVRQKAKEIFNKEAKTAKHDCNETRCMQDIAMAFQAELIATANVTKQGDGYFLALSIRNIMDEKAIYSKSVPCKNCDAYQVVDKLKALAGPVAAPATGGVSADNLSPGSLALPLVPAAPSLKGNAADAEGMTWAEVVKGNTAEDYGTYLESYPKGLHARQARDQIQKFEAYEKAKADQQEEQAWSAAQQDNTIGSYRHYLKQYPNGRYVALAKMKSKKADVLAMIQIPGKTYEIGKYEITQAQWQAVMGRNPSQFTRCGDDCPVEQVSWDDIQDFLAKLNQQTGKQYRLPTEAEWEYACHGGSQTEYCGSDNVDEVAWYDRNSNNTTHPVGQKQANGYGLHDMSGNVWEWVQDNYDNRYERRALRGGSWGDIPLIPKSVSAAARCLFPPAFRNVGFGFRLARTLP